MKLFFKLGLAVTAFVAISGNAWAEDYDWSGPYVGVSAGYGFGHADTFLGADFNTPGFFEQVNGAPTSLTPKGLNAGLYAGYNFIADPFVLGVEIDGSFLNLSDSGRQGPANAPDINGLSTELNGLGTARVRLGVANGRALMYATGGLALGAVSDTYTYDNDPMGYHDRWTSSSAAVGFVVGAGLEYAITNTVSIRGEYLHVNLGNKTFNPDDIAGGDVFGPGTDTRASFDHGYDIIRAGLSLRF